MTAVGVLGGSFDPVHRGHVALASAVRQALGLQHILLLPCAAPPHKPDRRLAARYHRLEMLWLAIEDRPGLAVSTLEIARSGVSYTIDSLRALRSGSPSIEPVFVCGSDALADVASWREHEALLAEFDFAAVTRAQGPGDPRERESPGMVTRRLAPLPAEGGAAPGVGGRVFRVPMPPLAISSSMVRARCRANRSIDDLVAARVARYIQRHGTYMEEGAR